MGGINTIISSVKSMNFFTLLDITVVAFIFYKIYHLIKETRAEQLLKGIMLIFLLIPISNFLNLTMLSWILNNTLTIALISIVIIFQPEIRRALEHLGSSTFNDKFSFQDEETLEKVTSEIIDAVESLAYSKTGALIVIEQNTGLGDIISTGTKLDACISSALLQNIFVVNTPLHDGAVIIRNDRIVAAGCFLPLSSNYTISKKLGTRHRSALGISENSDAITIIVSEETGVISLAVYGKLTRNYTPEKLKDILIRIIKQKYKKKSTFKERVKAWRKKDNMIS